MRSLAGVALGLACVATLAAAQGSGLAASIGTPQSGWLDDGAELPPSAPGLRFESPHSHPEAHYGTRALVEAVERAAAAVATDLPGGTMVVGDMSRRFGGPMLRHGSHTSGRDVDLLYYAVDDAGAPVPSRWIAFDAHGHAADGGPERFDAPRMWRLIRALLEDRTIDVMALFIAPHIESLVMAEATRASHDAALVARARRTLQPPGTAGTTPHDEHMHVRIACPPHQSACVARHRRGEPEAALAPLPAGWSLSLVVADDTSIVFADGARIGSSSVAPETSLYAWPTAAPHLAIQAENLEGTGGVLVEQRRADGSVMGSDARWRVWVARDAAGRDTPPPAGWEQPSFDDASWPHASEVAPYGAAPWERASWYFDDTTPARRIWAADPSARVVCLRAPAR